MLKTVVLVMAIVMIFVTFVNTNTANADRPEENRADQAQKSIEQGLEQFNKDNDNAAEAHFDKHARLTESPCPPEGC